MESSTTSQKQAERLFKKHEELAGDQVATSDYEQHAHAEREKMARLRELRLAREAESPAKQKKRRAT
jgi:hypothetical protein